MLAFANKHEDIVSYLRKWTSHNLHAYTLVLKEEINKRFGNQLTVSLKELCEHVNLDPEFISMDNLLDNFLANVQLPVEASEDIDAASFNELNEKDLELQSQVSEILQGLWKELRHYSASLPEKNKKDFENISVESLRPQLTAFVKQIKEDKEQLVYFAQEEDKETQERIEQIKADKQSSQQQLNRLAQQGSIKKAEEVVWVKNQESYRLATTNIAVPSMEYHFIPDDRLSNIQEIKEYMEFVRENIAEGSANMPLCVAQQQDLRFLVEQIYQEEQELALLYRNMKNILEHRGGDEVFLQQRAQNSSKEEKAAELEAKMIKRKLEDVQLAKKLLQELWSIREKVYEILKNKNQDVSKYISPLAQDASNFENDYSNKELVEYLNSCGEAPHTGFRKAFVGIMHTRNQQAFAYVMKRLGQSAPITTQDFINLLHQIPQFNQIVFAYNPQLREDMVIFKHRVKYIAQIILKMIVQSTPHPLGKTIQITSLQEIKKRIHKLTIAIEQQISKPTLMLTYTKK